MKSTGLLEWNLEALEHAMRLSKADVRLYFTDGRRVSFLLERRLANEVLRGRLAPSEGAGFDVIDSAGQKWEVRSISRGGIYFCPSYMVGSGRSFERQGFLDKLTDVRGYVVSDIESFPRVPYWLVDSRIVRGWWDRGLLGGATKISRVSALALLDGLD
jgi:hypothetical protein